MIATIDLPMMLRSVMQTDVLLPQPGDPEDGFEAIRSALDGWCIVATTANAEALRGALNDLSNHCDELAHMRSIETSERKVYRHAAQSAATLATHIRELSKSGSP